MDQKHSNTSPGHDLTFGSGTLRAREERYIDQISTLWSQVERMQEDRSARGHLLLRYYGAVHRYLRASLRDPNAADLADDLAQKFTQRFLDGAFDRADHRRGRFRDYVKAAIRNLIAEHYRRRDRAIPLPEGVPEPAAPDESIEDDHRFLESWRDQLLVRAWEELDRFQVRTGRPLHTVLRFRADHPDLRSARMAEHLSARLGRPVTDGWVRLTLLRARRKFGEFLLDDLAHSLEHPTPEQLEQELIDLGLRDYGREALSQWVGRRP